MGAKPYRQRFLDVTATGMRLRYLEWPSHSGADRETVLLLHDVGQSAEIWHAIALKLSERGYSVCALDTRGHGASSHSPSGRYAATALAEDVKGFILEKDLYSRPLAVMGCGVGAVVALHVALLSSPALVGAVGCIEFGLAPELVRAEGAQPRSGLASSTSSSACDSPGLRSCEAVPWWSWWLGQGATFASVAECAAFLCHPLANLGPEVLPLVLPPPAPSSLPPADPAACPRGREDDSLPSHPTPARAAELQKERERTAKHAMDALSRRPPAVAAFEAATTLKEAGHADFIDDFPTLEQRMDPRFFFDFDVGTLVRGLKSLRCHVLVVHGERSAFVSSQAADALARLPEHPASPPVCVCVPQGGHHIVSDAPSDVLQAIISFLEGPAANCFVPGREAADGRRPERMNLRPLPEYASLEEAQRALGPRALPSAAAVEEELRKLRVVESSGGNGDGAHASSSENEDAKRQTALAKDPPNYFGFVG
jgi:pimeloyl-ACP methyl ester carboxylesterase